MFKKTLSSIALATALGVTQAQVAAADVVDASFYPTRMAGPPSTG